MKTRNSIIAMMSIALMSAAVVMFSACEKDKATDAVDDYFGGAYSATERDSQQPESLSITPVSPSVDTVGEQVALTVRGGNKPYSWSVSDSTAGTITPSSTQTDVEQAIYRTLALTKNTVVVTDAKGRAAVVDVTVSTANLTISPPSFKFLATDMVSASRTATFTTSGGAGSITWSTDNGSLGSVAGGVWTSVSPGTTATVWSNTTVKVFATDANGSSVSAAITFD